MRWRHILTRNPIHLKIKKIKSRNYKMELDKIIMEHALNIKVKINNIIR